MRRFATLSLLIASMTACGPGVLSDPISAGDAGGPAASGHPTSGGDAGNPAEPAAPNPAPVVVSYGPTSADVGSAAFLLTVSGASLMAGSVVRWNGADRATAFINASELRAAIPDTDLASAATVEITVVNPPPGGGAAGPFHFEVRNRLPTLEKLDPPGVVFGEPDFHLTLTGTNFVSTSVVRWNGIDRATTFVSATQLAVLVPASEVGAVGAASVSVTNPAPGGGASNALDFSIENPRPTVSSFSPDSAVAGGASFTLTVDGTGFLPGSVVFLGSALPTTFISSTRLSATTKCADLASGGLALLHVSNPPPGGGPSIPISFPVLARPGNIGAFEHVSVTPFGNVEDGSAPAMTSDGRFIAFESFAGNLVAGDTNPTMDIFVRDRCAGAPAGCIPSTSLISRASEGTQANELSRLPSISPDGRFVSFLSLATNLVPDDSNASEDAFVRDTCAGAPSGCVVSTVRASVQSTRGLIPFASPMSADGRFIAFTALAGDFGPPVELVFVRDTCAGIPNGCVPSTSVVSADSNGATPGDADSNVPSMSADGRFIAFTSASAFLVPGDTNATFDVFLRDTCQGAPNGCVPSTVRVSVADDGSEANGGSGAPSISADGRVVAFLSDASNLVPGDTNSRFDLFVRDTCTRAAPDCVPSTTRIPLFGDSAANAGSFVATRGIPSISANGRFVAFDALGDNLAACDSPAYNVFVADTCVGAPAGCTISKVRVSESLSGTMANGNSFFPVISGDGRLVAFESQATNLLDATYAPGSSRSFVVLAHTGF